MATKKALALVQQHAAWRRGEAEKPNLSWANLSWADLGGADLSEANLSEADLRGAEIPNREWMRGLVSLSEVAGVVLAHPERLEMGEWHSDSEWKNGVAKPVEACGTTHCIAGWAEHLAALKDPRILEVKMHSYLIGRLILGDEAASHFYDSNEDAIAYLEEASHV